MTVATIEDTEFGSVAVRCNNRAKRVILRVDHDGQVRITIPHRRHLRDAQVLLNEARVRIRTQRQKSALNKPHYEPGAVVGRSHQLVFQARSDHEVKTWVSEEKIVVKYPLELAWDDEALQHKIHQAAKKALRRQAQSYLPTRTAHLAQQWETRYQGLRITSGQTRWGSCSSSGTISLNLWLMTLPEHLIDYVICHELCHTKEHNHSPNFWALVAQCLPDWQLRRKELKTHTPH